MTFPTGWTKRTKITSDNTKVSSSVKGLAVEFSNLDADFWGDVE